METVNDIITFEENVPQGLLQDRVSILEEKISRLEARLDETRMGCLLFLLFYIMVSIFHVMMILWSIY